MQTEWMIKNHKVTYDQEKDILYFIPAEFFKAADYEALFEIVTKVFKGRSENRHVLIDLVNLPPIPNIPKEDREAYRKKMTGQNPSADKIAIVGASPVVRMLAKMLSMLNKNKTTQFFKNEKEAFAWFAKRG